MATPNNMAEEQDEFSRLRANDVVPAHKSTMAKLDPKSMAELTKLKAEQNKLSPEDELAKQLANRPGGSYEFNAPLETNLGAISNTNPFTGEMRMDRLQPGPAIQSEPAPAAPTEQGTLEEQGLDQGSLVGFPKQAAAEETTIQPPGGGLTQAAMGKPEDTPLVGDLIDAFEPGKDDPFAWLAMYQQGKQMSTDLANRSQRRFNNLVKARETEASTVTGDFQRAVLSDLFKGGGQTTKRFDAIGNLVFPGLLAQKTASANAQTAASRAAQDAMGITSTVKEGLPGEPARVTWNIKGGPAPIEMNTAEAEAIMPHMVELQKTAGLSPYDAATEALLVYRGQK